MSAAITTLGFVGVTAVAGGVEMMVFPNGNVFVKAEWLDELPVSSYRLPGLALGAGLGAGSLVTTFGLARRPKCPGLGRLERLTGRHWSWAATITAAVGLGAWIGLEVLLIPERSPIEALYATLALAVLAMAATTSFRRVLAVE